MGEPLFFKNEYALCEKCRSKPGSPVLCPIYLHNGNVVRGLRNEVDMLHKEKDRDRKLIKALMGKLDL